MYIRIIHHAWYMIYDINKIHDIYIHTHLDSSSTLQALSLPSLLTCVSSKTPPQIPSISSSPVRSSQYLSPSHVIHSKPPPLFVLPPSSPSPLHSSSTQSLPYIRHHYAQAHHHLLCNISRASNINSSASASASASASPSAHNLLMHAQTASLATTSCTL